MWFSLFAGFDVFLCKADEEHVCNKCCSSYLQNEDHIFACSALRLHKIDIERCVHDSLQFECRFTIHCSLNVDAVDLVDLLVPGSLKFRVLKHPEDPSR